MVTKYLVTWTLYTITVTLEIILTKDDIFNWCYQVVAFPLLTCVTGLPQDFSLVNCLINISDIIVQAMNALHGMEWIATGKKW